MQIMPIRLEKEKYNAIKEDIQNKFAELDYREEDTDYVLAALQEITQEMGRKKYAKDDHKGCEHYTGEEHTIDEMIEGLMSMLRGKR